MGLPQTSMRRCHWGAGAVVPTGSYLLLFTLRVRAAVKYSALRKAHSIVLPVLGNDFHREKSICSHGLFSAHFSLSTTWLQMCVLTVSEKGDQLAQVDGSCCHSSCRGLALGGHWFSLLHIRPEIKSKLFKTPLALPMLFPEPFFSVWTILLLLWLLSNNLTNRLVFVSFFLTLKTHYNFSATHTQSSVSITWRIFMDTLPFQSPNPNPPHNSDRNL